MIIGTKRKEEVIPRNYFKFKSVLIDHGDSATVNTFTSKAQARAFARNWRRLHGDTCYVDTTGHPDLSSAMAYWVRFCHSIGREHWQRRGTTHLIDRQEPRFLRAIPRVSIDFVDADKVRRVCVQFVDGRDAVAFVDFAGGMAVRVGHEPNVDRDDVVKRATDFLTSL